MLTIPADIILEKNKLYNSEAFAELLEWQISETNETVRIANYNEDIFWGGFTWTKFWFEGGDEQDSGGDTAENIQVKVSAVDRLIQGYLEGLTSGGIGDRVIYRRVHTGHLGLSAVITASFEIVDIDAGPDNEWVIFNLGQENFFLSQFPANVYRRDVCRYRPWQTSVCPYVNNPVCNRSFDDCIWLDQESVFGGQPAIPGGAFNITSIRSLTALTSLDAKLHASGQSITSVLDAQLYSIGSYWRETKLDATLLLNWHTVSLDAILKPIPETTSIDAKLNGTQTSILSIDAVLYATETTTALDAQIKQIGKPGVPLSTSLDAQLESETSQTLALDAILFENKERVYLDGKLQKSQVSSLSIDALLSGLKRVSIDAKLNSTDNTSTFNLDAFLKKTETSTTSLDAKLNGEQTSDTSVDAQLYSIGSFYQECKLDAILYGEFIEDTTGEAIEDTAGDYIEDTTA